MCDETLEEKDHSENLFKVKCVLRNDHKLHTDGVRFVWSEYGYAESLMSLQDFVESSADPGPEHPEFLLMNDRVME